MTSPEPLLRVTLPLELVTPMIGGGVTPLTPDREVPVRVTAIRGALRWWWRALQTEPDLAKLRSDEMTIFGGVGKGAGEDAMASALRVRVTLDSKPRLIDAGVHELVAGKLRTLPTWKMDKRLEYALFPLQRSDKERRAWQSGGGVGNMPTAKVIDELLFTVHLELLSPPPGKHEPQRRQDLQSAIPRLMGAIHWWSQFGGLGASTRRGFGAFRLRGDPTISGWSGALASLPAPPPVKKGDQPTPTDRPLLCGAKLLLGPVEGTAERAHAAAVGLLKVFRQAENFARDEGRERNRPGRSRWPEADLVKETLGVAARMGNRSSQVPFTHPPRQRSEHPEDRTRGKALFAPRAAFGMPLIVQFKDDGDTPANAQILPNPEFTRKTETDRWASPVLIRPVSTPQGWRPAVLVLAGGAVPREARVKLTISEREQKQRRLTLEQELFKKWNKISTDSQRAIFAAARADGAPDARLGGAAEPIAALLRQNNGSAVEAFLTWLQRDNGYQPVAASTKSALQPTGGRHGR